MNKRYITTTIKQQNIVGNHGRDEVDKYCTDQLGGTGGWKRIWIEEGWLYGGGRWMDKVGWVDGRGGRIDELVDGKKRMDERMDW